MFREDQLVDGLEVRFETDTVENGKYIGEGILVGKMGKLCFVRVGNFAPILVPAENLHPIWMN